MEYFKSEIISLHGVGVSMQGGRPENQDDWTCLDTPLGFLVIVCDGMGGGPGGKTASYIVKNEIAETICECNPQVPRERALKMAAARAHQTLKEKMAENTSLIGMGSTFVAALLNSQSAVVAWAGDSRLYRLHGKKCQFRTQDHSLVAELVAKKVLTEEEARLSPQSNVITRGLGSLKNNVPDTVEIPYSKGDRLVLCTDGVWGIMKHSDLIKCLTQPAVSQQLVANLSAEIDQIGNSMGGGHDNHTIVMLEMGCSSQKKDRLPWERVLMISGVTVVTVAAITLSLRALIHSNDDSKTVTIETVNTGYVSTSPVETSAEDNHSHYSVQDQTIDEDKGHTDEAIVDTGRVEREDKIDSGPKENSQKPVEEKKSKTSPDKQEKKQTVIIQKKTIQDIIDICDLVKRSSWKSVDDAKKAVDDKRNKVSELFRKLMKQTEGTNVLPMVTKMAGVAENQNLWYVNREADKKTKKYTLTEPAKTKISELQDQLNKLLKKLSKKEKH